MVRAWLLLLVTFLFIRYVLPVVLRLVLTGFVRRQVRRAQQHTQAPFGGPLGPDAGRGAGPRSAPHEAPAPGQVRVDYVPPTAKTTRPDKPKRGEYVDYEEV